MNLDNNDDKQKTKTVLKTIFTLVNKKKMKDRTFTYAKIVKLIHLYQESDCLWNISCPDFRRQEKRQEVLSKISKVFSITPAEVKRKIRSLRATYLLERRKVLASEKKVRDGLETYVYEPILAWYKYMSFLDDIIVFRTPTAAETDNKLDERSDSRIRNKTTEYVEESRLENVEEIYYENGGNHFKRVEVSMPTEYLEAKYLYEKTMYQPDSIDMHDNSRNCFADDDQQSSLGGSTDNSGKDNEGLAALKADRIRAETEYFRRKAEYVDICIEKERKMQPLLIAKLKLEIELLRNRSLNAETNL